MGVVQIDGSRWQEPEWSEERTPEPLLSALTQTLGSGRVTGSVTMENEWENTHRKSWEGCILSEMMPQKADRSRVCRTAKIELSGK
jgi:hypothetical protein